MSVEIIQQRLLTYNCQNILEQENALKEIMQKIALMALSRNGFFQTAAFQGGTCLRILYGLQRFSEDLDFVLDRPDQNFTWQKYIHNMQEEFKTYGFSLEVKDRTKLDNVIKSAFLKTDSLGSILIIKDLRTNKPKLQIKLEIDTNPPEGAVSELKFLDFPLAYSVKTQNLSSLFSGKCHALLCREYLKGRDWYDFIWYVAKNVPINFDLLNHAITQAGPWKQKKIDINSQWVLDALKDKIEKIDWKMCRKDVEKFLNPRERLSLEVWSKDFFLSRLDKLSSYSS